MCEERSVIIETRRRIEETLHLLHQQHLSLQQRLSAYLDANTRTHKTIALQEELTVVRVQLDNITVELNSIPS